MKKLFLVSFLLVSFAFFPSFEVEATSNPVVVCVNCVAKDNLDMKASSFISKCRKGSVRSEFPTYLLDKSIGYILKESKKGDSDAKTAWKLLNDGRFKK